MNEFKSRLKDLDKIKGKYDAVLLMNFEEPFKDVNYFYFTGNNSSYSAFLYDFSEAKIITNELELPKVESEAWIKNINIFEKRKISEVLKNELKGHKKIGITELFPYFLAKKLNCEFIDISENLESIRAIKSKNEVNNIKHACKVSDKIFENLEKFIKPEVSEKQIMQFIKTETIKNNCDLPPFNPVVNSGRKTSIPHDTQPDRKISRSDIVMIDISCVYKKYNSDCTRMFFIGSINKKIKQQYELLKNIVAVSEDFVQAGTKAAELDGFIRKKLGALSKNFIHNSGHGIGLNVHEKPHISEKSKDILKEGMVFTIEPGVYFKDYGMRIEDIILLTRKGIKNLTKTSY